MGTVEVCRWVGIGRHTGYRRRTSLTTAAGTTYFHYDGTELVAESDGTGALTALYTYGPGGPVSLTRGGSTYFSCVR